VDVVLDKWDLREGHDSIAFMEKMVTDPTITKVLIVCDRIYAEKADGRAGGVGTETQIISPEVYAQINQDKFVCVVTERDSNGKAYVPTYYKSRIYIDLSVSERYAEGFEQLLRWIFDKPLFVRPAIGLPPSYLLDGVAPQLGTSPFLMRVIDGVKNDRAYARGALDEYLNVFSSNLERFRIGKNESELDDRVMNSIEEFTPSRNEYCQVLAVLTQYGHQLDYAPTLHRFFERLIPYLTRPSGVTSWNEGDYDNFKFIVHELFLYTIATLVKAEHFDATSYLLSKPYYAADSDNFRESATLSYAIFSSNVRSLEYRNTRLKLNRLSLHADILERRSGVSGVPFRYLMQADFICFLRSDLVEIGFPDRWYPVTLLYAYHQTGPFEVFARSMSRAYLRSALPLLGVSDLAEIKSKIAYYAATSGSLPRWQFQSFNPAVLLGYDKLGSRE
jgi:hypothetical protein